MKFVSFPNFNLEFKISNIAIKVFGINVYWYAIIIVFAIIVATIFLKRDDGKYNIKFENIFELMIFTLPVSIIFARIYYCIFNLNYYLNNPIEFFNIKSGGLAIYGGIIGGIITIVIYCRKEKLNILDITDYICPYLAIGQAIGRIGNFINVEAYGIKTNFILKMGILENGKYVEVHPCFLYEMIVTLLIFLILYFKRNKRKFKGEITVIYLLIYSFFRIFIEKLRTDSLMFYGFRISQILSIMIFCISFIYICYYHFKYIKKYFIKNTEKYLKK